MRLFILLLLAISLVACAYPRRSTSLSPIPNARDTHTAPAALWQLTVLSGSVPPRKRSGHAWDDDGGPDPYFKLYRDEQLVFESSPIEDEANPSWEITLPDNVMLPTHSHLRLELWDDDAGSDDIIGTWRSRGLPETALPDAIALVNLEGGSTLRIRISSPKPHAGVGIETFEVRSDHLLVMDVIRYSPAGRAGLSRGDRIVAIGGESIATLGEARAASALSLASERESPLTVERASGARTQIELDRGYVWLQM